MQTLIEKLYEQKVGEDRRYRTVWPDEIRIPMRFPGAGIEGRIELPGPEVPKVPLEVMLGCQVPQSLYAMYSFGVNDKPVTIGSWFEPLAGATLGPYPKPDMGFKPTSGWGYVTPDMSLGNGSGDIHDTFKVDRYDNVYGGHTTWQLPGGKHIKLNDW